MERGASSLKTPRRVEPRQHIGSFLTGHMDQRRISSFVLHRSAAVLLALLGLSAAGAADDIYSLASKNIDGGAFDFTTLKGKVVYVTNVASF
jgi:hypothetical protein